MIKEGYSWEPVRQHLLFRGRAHRLPADWTRVYHLLREWHLSFRSKVHRLPTDKLKFITHYNLKSTWQLSVGLWTIWEEPLSLLQLQVNFFGVAGL